MIGSTLSLCGGITRTETSSQVISWRPRTRGVFESQFVKTTNYRILMNTKLMKSFAAGLSDDSPQSSVLNLMFSSSFYESIM